jgi:hypothetical protein
MTNTLSSRAVFGVLVPALIVCAACSTEPSSALTPPPSSATTTSPSTTSAPRNLVMPDVVGMYWVDAEPLLRAAGWGAYWIEASMCRTPDIRPIGLRSSGPLPAS